MVSRIRYECAMTETLRVGRRSIEITNPGKALFARPRVTKLDLARYYERVAPAMLPHIRDRPLALQVFPRGIDQRGHFLKNAPEHFPDWIARAQVGKRGGSLTQVLANEAATLVYLAGQNAVTPHIWLARIDEPRRPDRLIIDFDPNPGVSFATIRAAAREAGDRLRGARPGPLSVGAAPPRGRRATGCATPASSRSRWSPAHAACTSCARCAAGRRSRTCTPTRAPLAGRGAAT